MILVIANLEAPIGTGVDVILDNVGGPYFQKNLDSLNIGGRLFIIGFMGGTTTQVNLACLLARRLTVQGIVFHLLYTKSPLLASYLDSLVRYLKSNGDVYLLDNSNRYTH